MVQQHPKRAGAVDDRPRRAHIRAQRRFAV